MPSCLSVEKRILVRNLSTHIYLLTRVVPAARFPERDPCRSSPRSAPASGDPMRHRTHHHRTVAAAAALVLLGTGAGSAEDVPAAAKPTAPEWSL